MNLKYNPCKDCKPPKRNAECHATCEEYAKAKEEHKRLMDQKNKEKSTEFALTEITKRKFKRHG